MAHQGYKVMDSDMHLIQPHDLWQRYIDPAFKSIAPIGANVVPRDGRVYVAGKNPADTPRKWGKYIAQHVVPQKQDYELADTRGYDNVSQLDAMDKEGIDVAVLFPPGGCSYLVSTARKRREKVVSSRLLQTLSRAPTTTGSTIFARWIAGA